MAATHWTGRGDGVSWADPMNWSSGVPSAGIDAAFGGSHTTIANLAGPSNALSAGALILEGCTLALANGVLDLAPQAAQSGNTDDLVIAHGAHLTVAATARVQGSNVAEIGEGTGGTLTVLGVVSEEYAIVRGAELDLRGPRGHWLSGDSGLYVQDSTFSVEGGAHVDTGGKLAQFPAAALEIEGDSAGSVSGSGSRVILANVFVSDAYGTSALTVEGGGSVYTGGGDIGGGGDGTLTVKGAGSLFSAMRGLRVGGQAPVNSTLVVEQGGTVRIGQLGLLLDGTLALDSSASFAAPTILSGGGRIDALAGNVVLSSRLELSDNDSAPFETKTTYVTAAQGATLTLKGAIGSAIPNDQSVTLEAGSGHIVLSHSSGAYGGSTAIYGATLEIAAAAAVGTGGLEFIGGSEPAVLQIDNGLAFHNAISGFGTADEIDLAGFSYQGSGPRLAWTSNATGGTLTLTNTAHQHQVLSFVGTDLSAMSFGVMGDSQGGTALIRSLA